MKLTPAVSDAPFAGEEMLTVGAVFTGACTVMLRTELVVLPCESVTVAVITCAPIDRLRA